MSCVLIFQESWQLRKGVSEIGDAADYDEELYVAGNMVIWSKGSKSQALAVYKAFTVDSTVQQVSSASLYSPLTVSWECGSVWKEACV